MSELYHYGVPGQKHGNRKYQNEDGSLTPEGRIHYGVGQGRGGKSSIVFKPGDKTSVKIKKAASSIKKDMKADISRSTRKQKGTISPAEAKKKNLKATLAVAGITALATSAAIAGGLIMSNRSKKLSVINSNPNIIDANDWATVGKLKLKDIGYDQEWTDEWRKERS